MNRFPTTHEELTAWLLTGEKFLVEEISENTEIWKWIVHTGMKVFPERFTFILEIDAGLGFRTHLYLFCGTLILIASDYSRKIRADLMTFDELKRYYPDIEIKEEII